jgi:YidC/Oxa1 family membrane protein insertase
MSSLTHAIGGIFQPILKFIAEILAFFFALIPSYPVAVALLTIVVMAALTPLTVKSTKNMAAMQALGPEMKKLQQKYKGPENRTLLNEEMMKLYKEHNVNPASGCLPMLLQMPFFFMLYSVIRGITNTVGKGAALPYTYEHGVFTPNVASKCASKVCADPRYISQTTKMYHDIVAAHGQLVSGGLDFASKLLSHHSSPWAYIPYAILVAGAVGLQYLQMARLNARNPQANQANPQAAMLQKYMPLIFGFIYLNVAAILNVYFIVSSAIRIGTQEVLFRKGIVAGPNSPAPAGSGSSRSIAAAKDNGVESTEKALPKPKRGANSTGGSPKAAGGKAGKGGTNGSGSSSNGSTADSGSGSGDGETPKKQHPRSKAKKERKAR